MDGFFIVLDVEREILVRRLRLEVGAKSLEDIVDGAVDRIRHDRAAVELADVEHGAEQARHRIERELLPLENAAQRRVVQRLPHRHAIEQIQRRERLPQVVARGREEAALCAVGFHQPFFFVLTDSCVAHGGDDEHAVRA